MSDFERMNRDQREKALVAAHNEMAKRRVTLFPRFHEFSADNYSSATMVWAAEKALTNANKVMAQSEGRTEIDLVALIGKLEATVGMLGRYIESAFEPAQPPF